MLRYICGLIIPLLVRLNQWMEFNSSILTGKSTSGQPAAAVDILSGTLYFSINYTLANVINSGDAGVLSDILKYEVT